MRQYTIALFGESEKGKFNTGYFCRSLGELAEYLGEPPNEESKGLDYAIQALLYKRDVLFFRVREEGFSVGDYITGLKLLTESDNTPQLAAICLPGVGNTEIIEATTEICTTHKSFLIISQTDLYDYLTSACRN